MTLISHALKFVPARNRPKAAQAFSTASCTRSSASLELDVQARATWWTRSRWRTTSSSNNNASRLRKPCIRPPGVSWHAHATSETEGHPRKVPAEVHSDMHGVVRGYAQSPQLAEQRR